MRRTLLHLPLILVVSLVVLPGAMSDAGGGARPGTTSDRHEITLDLSTRSGINQYLRSLGADPSEAVIQRGAHNYAGPNCPGSGWTCAPGAGVIVQLANHDDDDDDDDGDNVFVCSPQGDQVPPTSEETNTCVIVQDGPGTNRAVCREHNEQKEGFVEQTCMITQVNVSGSNQATVLQSVVMEHDDTEQRSHQRSHVIQFNGTGSNRAVVSQQSNLSLEGEEEEESGPVEQEQEAIQDSIVNQKTGCATPMANPLVCPEPPTGANAGDNLASVFQSHRLEAEVEEADSADQLQNAFFPFDIQLAGFPFDCVETPNVCSVVDQDSSNGDQRIDVRQVQRHVAEAEDVEFVFQQQGSSDTTGGLEAVNHQDSLGVSRRSKVQDERQFADAEDTGTAPAPCPPLPNMPCQLQFTGIGPKLNSNQELNEDNFAFGAQNVLQLASDPTYQQATLDAFAGPVSGLPDGATFRQFVRQNDETAQQTVTGTGFVEARIDCRQGTNPLDDGEGEIGIEQVEGCEIVFPPPDGNGTPT